MNPVFILLVLICAFLLWVFLSFAFRFIGGFVDEAITDVKEACKNEDKKESEDTEDEEQK